MDRGFYLLINLKKKMISKYILVFCGLWLFSHGYPERNETTQVVEFSNLPIFDTSEELLRYLRLSPYDEKIEILHEDRAAGVVQLYMSEVKKNEVITKMNNKVQHKVLFHDIERYLLREELLRQSTPLIDGEVTFERYMNLEEITNYLKKLQIDHPTKVRLESAGKSIEHRDILQVTITDDVTATSQKPVIFVEAGIHAREWINPAATLYLIQQLLETPSETADVEWRILPITNPDGYFHTWSARSVPSVRLWRKNRRSGVGACGPVDLNRNFGTNWGGGGSSWFWCAQTYRGTGSFSEPETQAIRDSALEVKPRIKAYIAVHSYSQLILHSPSVSTMCIPSKTLAATTALGKKMASAISGTTFRSGQTIDELYSAGGTSKDWAVTDLETHRSYTYELRDKGLFGFLLPEAQIAQSVVDLWEGMQVLSEDVRNNEPANPFTFKC